MIAEICIIEIYANSIHNVQKTLIYDTNSYE